MTDYTYTLTYETLVRRDRRRKTVEAAGPLQAMRAVPQTGSPLQLHDGDGGRMLWHRRAGWIDGHPERGVRPVYQAARIWPCPVWDRARLSQRMHADPDVGVYVAGGIAYVTARACSGQDRNLLGAIALADVLALVRDGRLRCVPVCFQHHWFYEQGSCPLGGLAFPSAPPVDPRAHLSGPTVAEVIGTEVAPALA